VKTLTLLLNENSKILDYHSLLRRPLNYIPGILFIFYSIFLILQVLFPCVVFSGLLSVQAFLPWSLVELVY